MQDRLQDLYKIADVRDNIDTSKDYNEAEMIEVPIDAEKLEVPEGLQEFTTQVEKLKLNIVELRSHTETLNSGYRSILISTETRDQEEKISQLERTMELSLQRISEALKKMNAENNDATVHARWRANVHALLTKQFMDVLLKYRHIQTEHREKVQVRIRQRLQIVKPDATAQEIEEVVGSGKLNVFAQQIHDDGQAQEALRYLEGRQRELLKIENSVTELNQLFLDMAALVNAQGEYIDDIEANVAQSGEFVITANKELAGALRRKNRNRKCAFICALFFTILLVIAIITILIVGNSNGWFKQM